MNSPPLFSLARMEMMWSIGDNRNVRAFCYFPLYHSHNGMQGLFFRFWQFCQPLFSQPPPFSFLCFLPAGDAPGAEISAFDGFVKSSTCIFTGAVLHFRGKEWMENGHEGCQNICGAVGNTELPAGRPATELCPVHPHRPHPRSGTGVGRKAVHQGGPAAGTDRGGPGVSGERPAAAYGL